MKQKNHNKSPAYTQLRAVATVVGILLFMLALAIVAVVPELAPRFKQGDDATGQSDVLGASTNEPARTTEADVTEIEPIPYDVQIVEDPSLAPGQEVVLSVGEAGESTIRYTRVKDKEGRQLVSTSITRRPLPKVIAVAPRSRSASSQAARRPNPPPAAPVPAQAPSQTASSEQSEPQPPSPGEPNPIDKGEKPTRLGPGHIITTPPPVTGPDDNVEDAAEAQSAH